MNILTLPISYFSVVFLICIQPSKPFVALMCSKCWCQWLPWFKAIIFSSQLSSAHNFFHLLRIKFKLNAAEISYESTHFFTYLYSNLKKIWIRQRKKVVSWGLLVKITFLQNELMNSTKYRFPEWENETHNGFEVNTFKVFSLKSSHGTNFIYEKEQLSRPVFILIK